MYQYFSGCCTCGLHWWLWQWLRVLYVKASFYRVSEPDVLLCVGTLGRRIELMTYRCTVHLKLYIIFKKNQLYMLFFYPIN